MGCAYGRAHWKQWMAELHVNSEYFWILMPYMIINFSYGRQSCMLDCPTYFWVSIHYTGIPSKTMWEWIVSIPRIIKPVNLRISQQALAAPQFSGSTAVPQFGKSKPWAFPDTHSAKIEVSEWLQSRNHNNNFVKIYLLDASIGRATHSIDSSGIPILQIISGWASPRASSKF